MAPKLVNLLVVDDDAQVRMAICCVLAELGYHVRSAKEGFSALAEIREQCPDIIVSDLNMPGMSGFELLSVVRRRFPSIRTIAMSGTFSDDGRQPGVSADAFYQKGAIGSLLRSVRALAHEEGESTRLRRCEPTLIWVPSDGATISGVPYVTISCQNCMRIFSQSLEAIAGFQRRTACVHCGDEIAFAVMDPTDPALPQSVQMRA